MSVSQSTRIYEPLQSVLGLPGTLAHEAHEIKKGLWARGRDLETLEANKAKGLGGIFWGEIKNK